MIAGLDERIQGSALELLTIMGMTWVGADSPPHLSRDGVVFPSL